MPINQTKHRNFKIDQVRALEDGGKRTIGGYAAVFNALSENMGWAIEVREQIKPGAFAESLSRDQQMAFWNHNVDFPIGSTKNKSLRLSEDAHGLAFELDLPDTNIGRDVFANVRDGIVDSMSFGFQIMSENDEELTLASEPSLPVIVTILRAKLIEVSPVVFPAYPQTEVESRARSEELSARILALTKTAEVCKNPQKTDDFERRALLEYQHALLQQEICGIE
jgi:HK97 family phage prohead protease